MLPFAGQLAALMGPQPQPEQEITSLTEAISPDILSQLMQLIGGASPDFAAQAQTHDPFSEDYTKERDRRAMTALGAGIMSAPDMATGFGQGIQGYIESQQRQDELKRRQDTDRGVQSAIGDYRAAGLLQNMMGGRGREEEAPFDMTRAAQYIAEKYGPEWVELLESMNPGSSSDLRAVEKVIYDRTRPPEAEPEPKPPARGAAIRGEKGVFYPGSGEQVDYPEGFTPASQSDPATEELRTLARQLAIIKQEAQLNELLSPSIGEELMMTDEQRSVVDGLLERLRALQEGQQAKKPF